MGEVQEGMITAQTGMMALTVVLIALALVILFKKGKEEPTKNTEQRTEITRTEEQGREALNAKKIYRMARELEDIQEELIQLKKEQKQLNHRMENYIKTNENQREQKVKEEQPFEQVLNYSLFAQKNQEVLQRFEEGMSPKEIAKVLDKSLREVEMVIKLAKQKK